MKFLKKNTSSGFTLIEILVVVAIVFIFAGFGIAYFDRYSENKLSEKETRKLVDILELAKKKSSASDIPPNVSDCTGIFQGYRVTVSSTGYVLEVRCVATGYVTLLTFYFQEGVTAVLSAPLSVYFPALNGTVSVNPKTGIKLKNSANTSCYYITVNEIGVITDTKIDCANTSSS